MNSNGLKADPEKMIRMKTPVMPPSFERLLLTAGGMIAAACLGYMIGDME